MTRRGYPDLAATVDEPARELTGETEYWRINTAGTDSAAGFGGRPKTVLMRGA